MEFVGLFLYMGSTSTPDGLDDVEMPMSEARSRKCIFEQPMKPTLSELNFRDLLKLIEEQMATVSCSLLKLHEQHQIELTQALTQSEKEVFKNSRKIRRTRKNISQCSQFSEACTSSPSAHSESERRKDSSP